MPVVDHCNRCARTRVNGWCPESSCNKTEVLTEANPRDTRFAGVTTQDLFDEIARRGILSR